LEGRGIRDPVLKAWEKQNFTTRNNMTRRIKAIRFVWELRVPFAFINQVSKGKKSANGISGIQGLNEGFPLGWRMDDQ
jgi:hypothetical protein